MTPRHASNAIVTFVIVFALGLLLLPPALNLFSSIVEAM